MSIRLSACLSFQWAVLVFCHSSTSRWVSSSGASSLAASTPTLSRWLLLSASFSLMSSASAAQERTNRASASS
eukprot:1426248-Heterocapsa_arctica.AAC.1